MKIIKTHTLKNCDVLSMTEVDFDGGDKFFEIMMTSTETFAIASSGFHGQAYDLPGRVIALGMHFHSGVSGTTRFDALFKAQFNFDYYINQDEKYGLQ